MTINGYEIIGEWHICNCGKIAQATKDGKEYFLKKYQGVVAPINNGTLDAKTFELIQKQFDDFVARKRALNARLREASELAPCDEFINGVFYVEVTEKLEGVLSPADFMLLAPDLLSNDISAKILLMTLAGSLAKLHSKGIIHGDVTHSNVMILRNLSGAYVGQLVGFDYSFPVEDIPDEIPASPEYCSPELGKYMFLEDYSEENKRTITEKTDIFSLGLVFHFYLTGTFPEPVSLTEKLQQRKDKGREIYPFLVLNSGCELRVSPKIANRNYASLISDMISLNPDDRPTATEILMRLKGGVDKSSSEAVTPPPPIGSFAAPWPEHNIAFDINAIKAKGFVSSIQKTIRGINGYEFVRSNGITMFFRLEMIIIFKLATEI